jgi:hypothetical protein
MKSLRTASFWIAAVFLPGGVLLLTPMAIRAAKRLRANSADWSRRKAKSHPEDGLLVTAFVH